MSAQIGDQVTYGKKKEDFTVDDEVNIENKAIKMALHSVYLIRGLPNAGKSTLGGILLHLYEELGMNADHFEANDYVYHPPGVNEDDPRFGKYIFDREKHGACWSLCLEAATTAMNDKDVNAVIVSNTFTTIGELEPFIDAAKAAGRTLFVIGMDNFHNGDNGRGVPLDVVADMTQRYHAFPFNRDLVSAPKTPPKFHKRFVGVENLQDPPGDPSLD